MTKFYAKVNKLLEEYIGGQIFFTELDKAVKFDRDILERLITYARQQTFMLNALTIASGEIGLAMHNFDIDVDILVPGGLRHDPSKINLEPFRNLIDGKNIAVILDEVPKITVGRIVLPDVAKIHTVRCLLQGQQAVRQPLKQVDMR